MRNRDRRLGMVLCLSALAGLVLGGCGGARFAADAPAPGIGMGVELEAEGMLSAEVAFSSDPIVARYARFTGGSSRPAKQSSEIRVVPGEESWTVERWRVPSREGAEPKIERRSTLSRGGDGSVLLRESRGGNEDLTTTFDPPVRLMGALMSQGERLESTSQLQVTTASGDRNEPGTGIAEVWYAGRQRVETPLGTFDADLLMTELTLDLGLVTILRQQRQWIATIRPGRTFLVAEDIIERRTVLGWTSESRLRLAIESIVR